MISKSLIFCQLLLSAVSATPVSDDDVNIKKAEGLELKENFFFGGRGSSNANSNSNKGNGCCFTLPCMCGKPECTPTGVAPSEPFYTAPGIELPPVGAGVPCGGQQTYLPPVVLQPQPTYLPTYVPPPADYGPSTVMTTITQTHTESSTITSLHVETSYDFHTTVLTSTYYSTQTFVLHPEATHTLTRTESYLVWPAYTHPAVPIYDPNPTPVVAGEPAVPCDSSGNGFGHAQPFSGFWPPHHGY